MTQVPWPVAIVTGMLGSGKTTLIQRVLHDASSANTLVIVNEFGAVGLDHLFFKAVTDDVVLLSNGCLCCTVRNDLQQTLSGVRRDWLAGRIEHLDRVLIETSGLAEPAPLIASLVTHPVLSEAFELHTVATLVDGEHGLDQLDRQATCRNQVRIADQLLVSKLDRVDRSSIRPLARELGALNPLTRARSVAKADLHTLLRRSTRAAPLRRLCDETGPHVSAVATLVLKPERILSWVTFQRWLASALDESGARLLRLKGCLSFDAFARPMLLQAVHHAFYPVLEVPRGSVPEECLIMIFEGQVPSALLSSASTIGLS